MAIQMKRSSRGQGTSCATMPVVHHTDLADPRYCRWYECKTCERRFDTFQALGGHQGTHAKVRSGDNGDACLLSLQVVAAAKLHRCRVCRKEFPTGQALGGHKRRHALEKHLFSRGIELRRRRQAVEELIRAAGELWQTKAEDNKKSNANSELVSAAKEFRLSI